MRSDIKQHLVAVSIISVLVAGIFVLFAPKDYGAQPAQVDGLPYIEVYSATWGENCNPELQKIIDVERSKPLERDENGVVIDKPRTQLIARDNVLDKITAICGGKNVCSFTPTPELLGEPLISCLKKLEIRYRCFDFDRLWVKTMSQGHNETIDCSKDLASFGKNQAAPK